MEAFYQRKVCPVDAIWRIRVVWASDVTEDALLLMLIVSILRAMRNRNLSGNGTLVVVLLFLILNHDSFEWHTSICVCLKMERGLVSKPIRTPATLPACRLVVRQGKVVDVAQGRREKGSRLRQQQTTDWDKSWSSCGRNGGDDTGTWSGYHRLTG